MVIDEYKNQIVKDILNENVIIKKSECYFLQTKAGIKRYSFAEFDSMMVQISTLLALGLPYTVYCGVMIDKW